MTGCDHDFGSVRVSDMRLKNASGLTRANGLPKQVAGNVKCKKCGENVPVDYNLAFIDGDSA